MPYIQVYHNPHFLEYNGNHSQIVLPTQPVASILVSGEAPLNERLEAAYARTQHGYQESSWFHDPAVIPHLRSTAVGDLIADHEGNYYVVEANGFQPYQPRVIAPVHQLAEAYRLLEAAVVAGNGSSLFIGARQALIAMHQLLSAEGYPQSETPILWHKAQPGDLVGSVEAGQFRVLARKLRPKWRAKRLLTHIPEGQIWIDSSRTWAVVVPVSAAEPPHVSYSGSLEIGEI
jgi:hypothetical protein